MDDSKKISVSFIILLVVLAFALNFRAVLLGLHRLHMDECLYSSYAVRMLTHGDLSLNGGLQVDKPPVYFYSIALSFLVNGISENSARIPNILFSLMTVFFLYRLSLILFRNTAVAMMACVFLAFSVYYVLFSVTAFADISMTMFFILALLRAAEGKQKASGVFYALSLACKPMTLFLFPLYFVFILMYDSLDKEKIKKYLLGAFYVLAPLFIWSALLANPRFGMFKFFITQQPEAMKAAPDFAARFAQWWAHSSTLLNGYVFLCVALAGIVFSFIYSLITKKKTEFKADGFILLSILYTYLVFTVLNFRQFDRYLVVLAPFTALAAGRVSVLLASSLKNRFAVTAVFIGIIFVYAWPLRDLPQAKYNMGALFEDADGFDSAAAYLKTQASPDTRLTYFKGSTSWYGYFYLADIKFASALSVHSLEELESLPKDKRNLLVVNTLTSSERENMIIASKYPQVFRVTLPDNRPKFIIYDLKTKKSGTTND